IWHNILESIRKDSYRDQRFAYYRVAQLLQETLASQGQKVEPILNDTFLNELEDIAFLTCEFDKFFALICKHSVEYRRHRLSDIALQVSHRIDVGYENPDLSPLRIADEMGMSSAYLSRLFKESLGQSIGEYMNNVRIKNASNLLLTTELSVESIAYKVGFGNPKYFFVVFKNVTGNTPLQFRQLHSEEISED
ncbi:MAG: AraC family transcriptional regulator, partial [Oscillospiraceae bacterium]